MAVMIRTSTWMGVLPPTRSMTFSCRTRRNFDLEVGGGAVDVIQKDGAAVGLFEFALFVPDGAGEGAPHVPEELALQEGLGQRAATDLDEGPAFREELVWM